MYAVTTLPDGRVSWREIASSGEAQDGEEVLEEAPQLSIAEYTEDLTAAIQQWLDQRAQGNGYDSIATCVSYKDSTVSQWSQDAAAAIAWRDAVWQAAFAYQVSHAENPPDPLPTAAEIIGQMPQPESYGWTEHTPGQSVS